MKKIIITALLLSTIFLLSGCNKKDTVLSAFELNITNFTANITEINEAISNIDTSAEDADEMILAYLDTLNEQILLLSTLDIPDEFTNIETLADDATTYMAEALELFTEAYKSEDFDMATFEAAKENYERAMTRINFISLLLQGELPEGDNVTITEGDDTEFDAVVHEEDELIEE